jgi:RNA-directed DNA polymerase
MTEAEIARELFASAAQAGNSQHKRAYLIHLPDIVLTLAADIAEGRYRPQPFTVFAVTDPKLREIFAPAFADRLVQQWLVKHIEPWFDRRFIDDSFANRKGRGTQAAILRLQRFMRQPGHRWYCKLDIRAFFPSIDRNITLALWREALPRLPYDAETLIQLDQVATAILLQSPNDPPPRYSGNRELLRQVPPHKSLIHAPPGIGLPIGSLTSQFFANVYLNELDQFVKHTLKVRGYLRYVDDFVLLADSSEELIAHSERIGTFLRERLRLELHPDKRVLQRTRQGVDFLGCIVFPDHALTRQRSVRALRRRLAWFKWLIFPETERCVPQPPMGTWKRWLADHQALKAPGIPSPALLQRMLATINSYYGMFGHSNTYRLRKHVYEKELGSLKTFFLPDGPAYHHLTIRKTWLLA